jgi:hypothetical protein
MKNLNIKSSCGVKNKRYNKALKVASALIVIGILPSLFITGSYYSIINNLSQLGAFLMALGWLEKFIIICVAGWIIFVLNVKRITRNHFREVIVKAQTSKKAKPIVKGWMANKSQGAPERENRLNISVLDQSGECVARQSSELISLSERTRFAIPTQNTGEEKFKVQTAEWINGESMPVITR